MSDSRRVKRESKRKPCPSSCWMAGKRVGFFPPSHIKQADHVFYLDTSYTSGFFFFLLFFFFAVVMSLLAEGGRLSWLRSDIAPSLGRNCQNRGTG